MNDELLLPTQFTAVMVALYATLNSSVTLQAVEDVLQTGLEFEVFGEIEIS